MYPVFISCPKGLERLLEQELQGLSIKVDKQTVGGLYATLSLEAYYQLVIQTRLANRVLIQLFSKKISHSKDIYEAASSYDWASQFVVNKTINIHFKGTNHYINNTLYGAQLIKDGISDYFRQREGERPSVAKRDPNIQLHVHLKNNHLSVYIDPVGYSLHRRGYRAQQGDAPIKENVASALLSLSNWEELASHGGSLIDPFCGSGTLLIEAYFMATHTAPGLCRDHAALSHWLPHQPSEFEIMLNKAKSQIVDYHGQIMGFDADEKMVSMAQAHLHSLSLEKHITVFKKTVDNLSAPKHLNQGLLICNPPYGERLSEERALFSVYQTLGKRAKAHCEGWYLGVISSSERLLRAIGLRAHKKSALKNGALDCQFLLFELAKDNHFNPNALDKLTEDEGMLVNRLKKNQRKLKSWLRQEKIDCYRLYDADLPDYNAAIDIYNDWVHVQEYAPPKSIDEKKAIKRLNTLLTVLVSELGFDEDKIILKQRQRQRSTNQYELISKTQKRFLVKEGNVQCWVNLHDYIDTGLFLDHRRLRQRFEAMAAKRFLNLYCYTGVASLHAARGGAISTNVDLSKTYLNWAKDNFRANHLTIDKHQFIHADVQSWLAENQDQYDVIFCDPPSFSNSKRMEGVLDIQKDHPDIIRLCMNRLKKSGTLYFSCNLKRFKLDEKIKANFNVTDITQKTTSKDFDESRHKHLAFEISFKATE